MTEEVDCSFGTVEDKALETSRILLINLGARMMRGLKSATTADEHSTLILCIKVIEKEQRLRDIGPGHQHTINAAPKVESGDR